MRASRISSRTMFSDVGGSKRAIIEARPLAHVWSASPIAVYMSRKKPFVFLRMMSDSSHKVAVCLPDVPSHVKVFRPVEVVFEVVPDRLCTCRITVKLITFRRSIFCLLGVEAISKSYTATICSFIPVHNVIWKVKRVEA